MSYNPNAGSISGASDAALSNPSDDQFLVYDASIDKWVNRQATVDVVDGLQTALDLKLDSKNDIVELTNPTNDTFARVNITDDGTPTGDWPDRLAFYFNGTRTGYFNEYGEIRARPAKPSTVAMRAMSRADAPNTNDIFQVANLGSAGVLLGVSKKYLTNNGLTKHNNYTTNSGESYIEKTELNYPVNTANPELHQVWVDGFKASWQNEWGALRGTAPYAPYGDALVRAIRTNDDNIGNNRSGYNALEIIDRRTGAGPNPMWGRSWVDGSLTRNGNTMADVYVMENGGTPPSTLPPGTVIVELDA